MTIPYEALLPLAIVGVIMVTGGTVIESLNRHYNNDKVLIPSSI